MTSCHSHILLALAALAQSPGSSYALALPP